MHVLIIGIGPGGLDQLTQQAITALNQVDLFVVADKGARTSGLIELRTQICRRYISHDRYRILDVADPDRGPDADRDADGYRRGVADWHAERAARFRTALEQEVAQGRLATTGTVGLLAWGDPALYDSTIRITEMILADLPWSADFSVIPGISSIQLLAAAHRIVLNQVGQPVHITTGRRLVSEYRPELGSVVVMLDRGLACAALDHDLDIFWGANLGSTDQVIISGRLSEVIEQIRQERARLKEHQGWVMDTYLLRPHQRSSSSPSTSR